MKRFFSELCTPFPNLSTLKPTTDVAWKFWVPRSSELLNEAMQQVNEKISKRNQMVEELQQLLFPITSTKTNDSFGAVDSDTISAFHDQLKLTFSAESFYLGSHIRKTKIARLFEIASTLEELDLAWKMLQINRVNCSESQIEFSDAAICFALRTCLQNSSHEKFNMLNEYIDGSNAKRMQLISVFAKLPSILESERRNVEGVEKKEWNQSIAYVLEKIVERETYSLTPSESLLCWLSQRTNSLELLLGIYHAMGDFGYLEFGTERNAILNHLLNICQQELPIDGELYELILNECLHAGIQVDHLHWARCAVIFKFCNENKDKSNEIAQKLNNKISNADFEMLINWIHQ